MIINKKVAILGSTSHIAKNLIIGLSQKGNYDLYLFARDLNSLTHFVQLKINNKNKILCITGFNDFQIHEYDVVINCVGIGDPAKLRTIGAGIFALTEEFDNLILNYMHNRNVLYLNFSSGAVYGTEFSTPVDQDTMATLNINHMSAQDFYSIAKINTEAKHRAYSKYNIVDLRVFGFFSRYIDRQSPYFLNDIVNSISENKVFITGSNDMTRDYLHPSDLLQIVERCMEVEEINEAFDVYSLKPATKMEIIEYFVQNRSLKVEIHETNVKDSPTGNKSNYYSIYNKAECIGYRPLYNSMESIESECRVMI